LARNITNEDSFVMADIRSCGVLVFSTNLLAGFDEDSSEDSSASEDSRFERFLLMKHRARWDLPKGHVDSGESDLECALRELVEETSITSQQIKLDERFRYIDRYVIDNGKKKGKTKELVIYLAELTERVEIELTEHIGFEWVKWDPPHAIQKKTIDPLLSYAHDYLASDNSNGRLRVG